MAKDLLSGIRAQDLEAVVVLAAQMQAQSKQDTILNDETIDAIAEQIGIPETYLAIANQEVQARRKARAKYQKALLIGLGAAVALSLSFWVPGLLPKDPQMMRLQSEKVREQAFDQRKADHPEAALKLAKQAVKLNPRNVAAWNELALAYEDLGLLIEAQQTFHEAIKRGGDDPETRWPYYNLGRLLDESSRKNEAIQYYRKAIQVHPGYADAHYNLGWTLEQLGRYDEAIGAYRDALKHKAGHQNAKTHLDNLMARLGRSR